MSRAAALLDRLAGEPDRFPAALLLTGATAAELDAAAVRLAARLLCPGEDPEGRCASCRRVGAGLHPDFFSVEPEGAVSQIRIDRVREAIVFGAGRPYEARRRIARISRAHLLGAEAGNALLKTLEEPGERFRWILTSTRPDSLLSTIRSRATPVRLTDRGLAERRREWEARGFSEDDARDLVLLVGDDDPDPAARLAERREARHVAVAALEEGLLQKRLTPMVLLAEGLEREPADGDLLAELLADAALASANPEALRHGAVAGRLANLSRRIDAGALRQAAVAAADPPADRRRGNRRLHYEKVLLELYAAAIRER